MDASSFFFGIGVVASAGFVLYAISRGERGSYAPPDHYRTALGHITANDPEAALESLRLTVQSPHAPPDAYIRLGNLLRARGQPQAALQVHRSLTVRRDLHPHERTATLRELAEDHRALGQHAEALAVLEQLATVRRDAPVLAEIAHAELQQGKFDAAVAAMREAQRLGGIGAGDLASFLAAVATECIRRKNASDAKRYLQQALKEDDACPQALALLGDLANAEKDHESALYYWQKLVFAGTGSAGVHEKLERVYFELGRFGDVERVYTQILESRPRDLETLLAAARIALKKGETEDAERLLRDALEVAPGSRLAFQMLAGLWLDENNIRGVRDLVAAHATHCGDTRPLACPNCGRGAETQPGYCIGCGRFGEYRAS